MRSFLAAAFAFACLSVLSGCSHSAPPAGRWEGTYVTKDVIIAARVEITSKGDIFLSAPDAVGIGGASDEDRAAIRQRLADGLNQSWNSVTARRMDFDGTTFRKPGGIAPQMEWDSSSNTMTLIVYFGTEPAIHIQLRPVKDFSSDPFSNA